MENNCSKGAEWRKWDLHIHSNASDGNSDTNEIVRVAKEKGLSVIALTDHHTARNIDKIKSEGVAEQISIISGIEFRTEYGQKSVHMIGFFPDEYNGTVLNSQALHDLILSPLNLSETIIKQKGKEKQKDCSDDEAFKIGMFLVQVDFKSAANLIHKYGGIVSVHAGTKENSFDNEMKHVGSSPKNVHELYDSLGTVKEELLNNGYIDICEIRKENDSDKFYLTTFGKPSIIASDAHQVVNVGDKYTWIKADPNFEGLKQILNEPLERVFIGDKPSVFNRVITNRTKYIKELNITQVAGYDGRYGKWFDDVKIPLNKELVAIIGNKGSGKSAIADMIALCSDYNNQDDFSFLRKKKFRDGKHAKNFIATLQWESGKSVPKSLDESASVGAIEDVKYLPQGQFERLTNEVSSTEEFQNEIEKVVFTHIDESERYNTSTFGELVEFQKQSVDAEIQSLVSDLNQLNSDIILLEAKENPTYKVDLEKKKKKKEEEFRALIEPPIVSDPNEDPIKRQASEDQLRVIVQLKGEIIVLETQQKEYESTKKQLLLDLQFLKQTRQEIGFKELELQQYIIAKNEAFIALGIDISSVFSVKTDYTQLDSFVQIKELSLKELRVILGEGELSEAELSRSIPVQLNNAHKALESEQTKLGTEQKVFQQYLLDKAAWAKKKNDIIGDINTPDTIEFYKSCIDYIETKLNLELEEKYLLRKERIKDIFKRKLEVINIYKAVKKKIDSVINENKDLLKTYPINIEASLVLKPDFVQKFMSYINKQKAGTFRNNIDGEEQLKKIITGVDFDNEESVVAFLDLIIESLKKDQREGQDNNQYRFVGDQVSEIKEFYTYLFSLSFLDYNYQLKQGDKKLEQLSPGERGALLLIFYLLLDKNDIPLIIDQPEDNLDNYSVANILVPFIREAKKKRQIIMVTHNPNLAVVADAEQVIFANLEKENDNKFSFISGSIENREVNKCIVKVLEGAMPAFNKRKQKYYE